MDTTKRRTSLTRILIILVIGVGLGLAVHFSPAFFIKKDSPPQVVHLKTGGTSAVAMILENRWRLRYRKEKGIEVDYDSTGSTQGIKKMIEGTYTIGFTHAPMTAKQREEAKARGGEVLHIPVALCAVVPIYNVKELKHKPPLKFTGDVLADIFLGKIERWNDPALQQLNDGITLPDTPITVVHREDSSGTTSIFTDYLQGASTRWRQQIGPAASKVNWPTGVGMRRNQGVAIRVWLTEGAIGYVDLLNAFDGSVQYGAVQNKDRTAFIHAEAPNMMAAAKGLDAEIPENHLAFSLTNRPGHDAYPISAGIWAVCYRVQPAATEKNVRDFLQWVTHEGQKYATAMSYAPLPEPLVQRVEQRLKLITAVP